MTGMKRIICVLTLLCAVWCCKAQDCKALVLPRFGNDMEIMAAYPEDKIEYYCMFTRTAFYESDTIPMGVDVYSISEVKEKYGDAYLPADYVVDLATLSYYAYNFHDFQLQYPTGGTTICFATPASAHPYLVLRSIDETTRMVMEQFHAKYDNQ